MQAKWISRAKWLLITVGVVGLLLWGATFAVIYVVEKKVGPANGLNLKLRDIDYNLLTLHAAIRGFEVLDDEGKTVVSLELAEANLEFWPLIAGNLEVQFVRIADLRVNLVERESSTNIGALIQAINQAASSASIDTEVVEGTEPADEEPSTAKINVQQFAFENFVIDYQSPQEQPTNTLFSLGSILFNDLNIDLATQHLSLNYFEVNDLAPRAWRNADGLINIQRFGQILQSELPPSTADSSPPLAEDESTPWWISVGRGELNRYSLSYWDYSLERHGNVVLGPFNTSINGFSLDPGSQTDVTLTGQIADTGKVEVSLSLQLDPFEYEVDYRISEVDLAAFQPFADGFTWAEIRSGRFATDGILSLSLDRGMTFDGGVHLNNFEILDRRNNQLIAAYDALNVNDIEFRSLQNTLSIDTVHLDEPSIHLVVNQDGSINLSDLIRGSSDDSAPAEEVEEPASEEGGLLFTAREVRVSDGEFEYVDNSLSTPFDMVIGIEELRLDKLSNVDVLEGGAIRLNFGGHGTASFDAGTQGGVTQANYGISELPMAKISGYVEEFAGWEVEGGYLDLEGGYTLQDRVIDMDNELALTNARFGSGVESDSSLPLPFAVALLEDVNKRATFEVPVKGSLDDPDFSIVRIFMDVIRQAVVGAVSSPFKLIGAVAGRNDLEDMYFEPGDADLNSDSEEKLDLIASTIQKHTEMGVRITPTAHELLDSLTLDTDVADAVSDGDSVADYFTSVTGGSAADTLARAGLGSGASQEEVDNKLLEVLANRDENLHAQLEELAIERAEEIKEYLMDEHDIAASRIKIMDPVLISGDDVELIKCVVDVMPLN